MTLPPTSPSKSSTTLLGDAHYALLFLPATRREVVTAIHVFCGELADIPNEVRDPGVAHAKLGWWKKEINLSFDGHPTHPVMQALAPHLHEFGIERHHLLSVADGCEMDLTQFRYFSYPELVRYCDLVSGAVEEACARVFGQTATETSAYARKAGLALQLTRIICNVGNDARRSRIYLPADDLDRFGVKESEILSGAHSDRFVKLMAFQTERARTTYDDALALLPAADQRSQKPGLTLISLYRTLLHEIERSDFHVLQQRIALTPLRKFWLAWKMQALGRL